MICLRLTPHPIALALRIAIVLGLCGVLAAPAENIVFPSDAGVFDVRRDGGAKGDGVTDDTAALQAAVSQNGRLVYLPNGTYLISDRLPFAAGDRRSHRIILQGQSTTGTVVRLRDHAPLFRDPSAPRALVTTGRAPAQCFRHSLRNLTFDTGTGNPGAIGVQYFANNQGTMSHVAIRSGDGAGAIGLDLGYTNEQGPCFIEQVSVEGFDVGIALKHGVNSVTMEHVRLSGQRLVGIRNDGQPLWIRGLASTNACPALDSPGRGGLVTLVDASLQGSGRAEHLAAIVSASQLHLRNVATAGYARPVQAIASFKVEMPQEDSIQEWVSHPVFRLASGPGGALNLLPVKETPDVPWDDPSTWQSVAQFAPETREFKDTKGRTQTVADWTAAFQAAIDSGATTVYFPRGREYGVFGEVRVRGNVRRITALEAGFRTPAGAPRGRIVTDLGSSETVVIERFDPLYASIELVHAAPRTLVYRNSCGMNLQTRLGAGDLFLVDVAPEHPWPDRGSIPTILRIDHTVVWARQFNPEGNQGIKILNQGGTFWALGIKTEGDSTCLQTTAGGRSEVLGAFIYANSGRPKQPLFITEDADLSVTYCENVIRNAPFTNVLVEVRGGTTNTLAMTALLPRGGGSMAPLLVSRQATGPSDIPPPANPLPGNQPPLVAFDAPIEPLREGASATVVVRRLGDVAASCVVPLEVRGAAHRVRIDPPTVSFAPGQTQADVRVTVLQDEALSPPSQVLLDLALGSGLVLEGNVASMTLEDDDAPPAGQGTGLQADYFAGTNWAQAVTSRVDRAVDFAWDKKPPVSELKPEAGYAVRWTGFVEPQFSEPYTFALEVGKYSRARLWVDGQLVADAWDGPAPRIAPISLQAGKRHTVRLEYQHQHAYGSLIRLSWSSPSQFPCPIPPSQLHPAR